MLEDFEKLISEHSFVSDEVMKESNRLGFNFRGISETQMRKFFNQVRIIQTRGENIPLQLRLLQAQVAYAVGRGKVTGVTPEFRRFFNLCVQKLVGGALFDEFMKFYEAMYGYFYYWAKLEEEIYNLRRRFRSVEEGMRKARGDEKKRLEQLSAEGLIDERINLQFKPVI